MERERCDKERKSGVVGEGGGREKDKSGKRGSKMLLRERREGRAEICRVKNW